MSTTETNLTDLERKRHRSYRRQGSNYPGSCKIGELRDNTGDTLIHEAAKALELLHMKRDGKKVITEAVNPLTGVRRDLVDLTDGEIHEYETDADRAARHSKGINVWLVQGVRLADKDSITYTIQLTRHRK